MYFCAQFMDGGSTLMEMTDYASRTMGTFDSAFRRDMIVPSMVKELDSVILTVDFPEHGPRRGDIGTVVLVHRQGAGHEVEFVTLDGETIGVVTVFASQVRPIGHREIAHARPVAMPA